MVQLSLAHAAKIDEIFSRWQSDESPGCAIGVYRDGEMAYARGYGMANLEHGIPITPDSIFHVASISKQFTAHCLALLEEDGKLSLDNDIRDYFPEIPDYGQKITVRQLMHHTSGLRDQWVLLRLSGWRPDDVITDADVLDICLRQSGAQLRSR
ncbi:MAG: serine hydrolase domain-containing protein [Thermomicrobiales bacterium]